MLIWDICFFFLITTHEHQETPGAYIIMYLSSSNTSLPLRGHLASAKSASAYTSLNFMRLSQQFTHTENMKNINKFPKKRAAKRTEQKNNKEKNNFAIDWDIQIHRTRAYVHKFLLNADPIQATRTVNEKKSSPKRHYFANYVRAQIFPFSRRQGGVEWDHGTATSSWT